MKRFFLSMACLSAVSCGVPANPPPGMPLDKDLLPQSGDSAITKLTQ